MAKATRLLGTRPIDEAVLDLLVDRTLVSPSLRRASARIRREQRRLRALVGDDAWLLYLRAEDITNERLDKALSAVARAAFKEGLRAGRGGPR